jgi:transposase
MEMAASLNISNQKAARWRKRFLQLGLAGLVKDAPRPGRKPAISSQVKEELIRRTANATHWSTRTMAAEMGVSEATVRRVWHAHGLKPHLVESFKISKDKRFAEKLEDIVGLYLNPPEHAIVMCVDEKSQIQVLDRTQPGLPLNKGRCGTMTHDYKRNGTATLFAALNVADGTVISMCDDRHRHQEWLQFLRVIDQVTPGQERSALDCGQLCHPQACQGTAVVETASALSCAFHAHQFVVAEHGGALFPRPYAEPIAPWRLPRRRGVNHGHWGLHRSSQPESQAIHLDRQGE